MVIARCCDGFVMGFESKPDAERTVIDKQHLKILVSEYGSLLAEDSAAGSPSREKLREEIRVATRRTLEDRPWDNCPCEICRAASVEVMIFRGSNRNKRRGFHNLGVFFRHVRGLLDKEMASANVQVPRRHRTTERRA